MSKYWSAVVGELTPYVPGEQPQQSDIVKLNTNENPYGPSPLALSAIQAAASDDLRRYPDSQSSRIKGLLAEQNNLSPSQVFVGNGSDEVLAHIFRALLKHDRPILFPDITYSFYPVYCSLFGIDYEQVPLGAAFEVDLGDYERPNGGVIFANPNAPTGKAIDAARIESYLQTNQDSVVVVDEAYIAFGGDSIVELVNRYKNLVVVQTLSKSHALAGLRVGFAFADEGLIQGLDRVKDSFNSYPLDRLAQAGALAALNDTDYLRTTVTRVIASRQRLTNELETLNFDVFPSSANFIFASHAHLQAQDIVAKLRERAIIVRHFNHPRTANYLRITVGTDPEIDRLLEALSDIVAAVK